jgi:hypothetical protein
VSAPDLAALIEFVCAAEALDRLADEGKLSMEEYEDKLCQLQREYRAALAAPQDGAR